MLKRGGRISSAAAAVKDLLSSLELWEKTREQQAAVVWEEVVGGPIAAQTEVLSAERGVLHVRTRTPAWAQELALQEEEIRRRLNTRLGGDFIREVRFNTRGSFRRSEAEVHCEQPPQPRPGELGAVALDAADQALIAEAMEQTGDPDLAAAVRRVMAGQIKLAKWRGTHGWQPCICCGELVLRNDLCAGCQVAGRKDRFVVAP